MATSVCTASTAVSLVSTVTSLTSPTISTSVSGSEAAEAAASTETVVVSANADCIDELGRATASACMIDDDFGSSDEVKIFKDEGEDEEKEFASQEELQAALSEDKSSLIQETELSIKQESLRLGDPCKSFFKTHLYLDYSMFV